ncbi:MAG: hypothetical protein ABI968_15475 [Acidobacteriota bacterium]
MLQGPPDGARYRWFAHSGSGADSHICAGGADGDASSLLLSYIDTDRGAWNADPDTGDACDDSDSDGLRDADGSRNLDRDPDRHSGRDGHARRIPHDPGHGDARAKLNSDARAVPDSDGNFRSINGHLDTPARPDADPEPHGHAHGDAD